MGQLVLGDLLIRLCDGLWVLLINMQPACSVCLHLVIFMVTLELYLGILG